jgi:dihydroorotate dehydrogenase
MQFKYEYIKNILFMLKPETAHKIAEIFLRILPYCNILFYYMTHKNFVLDRKLRQNLLGKEFLNPVGLGAGFDKNANMIKSMTALGFGFSEVGTITLLPQDGNKKPRLFRLEEEESLQNAMGFNNLGAGYAIKKLSNIYPFCLPVGVNIGKNKNTELEDVIYDYQFLVHAFKNHADYLTINLSSPNTPNLRDLQNESFIKELFEKLTKITDQPILLKIAPDMSTKNAISICTSAINAGASGIIIANTSTDYSLTKSAKIFGGLSGKVIQNKSYEFFKAVAKELFGKTVLISVGGIDSSQEAYKRIKAGASLVQVYSALVFKGTGLIKEINSGILELLEKDGFKNIEDAIGSDFS